MTSNCSLLGDLQEPFRWIADAVVMEAFESNAMDLRDFYFTGDDYRYRFDPEVKQQFLELLRERFNSRVEYKGRAFKWDSVVEQKTVELGRYLVGRTSALDFSEPSLNLNRTDDLEIRRRILSLTNSEARKLRIGKSTLHYLRKNVENERSFKFYRRIAQRLGVEAPQPKPPCQ